MKQEAIFLPVLLMVAHTFLVWCWMYIDRLRALSTSNVSLETFTNRKTVANTEGAGSTASDNLLNLFELPVLFYIATLVLFQLQWVSPVFLGLAWSYAALRIAHSLIHIGYNNVLHRFIVYFLGSCVLWAVWAGIATRFLFT